MPLANVGSNNKEEVMLTTKNIAKKIREELKASLPDCKFSVRTEYFSLGSAIHIALMSTESSPFADGSVMGDMQINNYYINENSKLSDFGKQTMIQVNEIVRNYHRDDSDIMTDYFNCNFYYHLRIGRWDKPFQVKWRKK